MTPQPVSQKTDKDRRRAELSAAARVTLVGMLLDGFLAIGKCIIGALFHSQAMIADGIHSFSDVASDLLVLGVMRLSRQAPDQSHPYGHERFETMGTLALGSVLIAVGAALAWDNIERLTNPESALMPGWPVLVVAAVSVMGKEWIYHYTRRVGIAIGSDLILANAWHSRTDALSSVVVLLSTVGAMMGYLWLDVLAAVLIAAFVGYIGWQFVWSSAKELVDTALSAGDIRIMTALAKNTEGVRDVHELRSRRMAGDILVDVHLLVDPKISVSEGHQIGMRVVSQLKETFSNIKDITFHIDAENAESELATDPTLPSRMEVWQLLEEPTGKLPTGSRLALHYLEGKVHIELFIADTPDTTRVHNLTRHVSDRPWLGSFRVWHPAD
ncbi:MAG: cation transporter [Oleiphilaceae bacterium]|nr:cation transporter [Oleiphilaceae bacterium]